LRENNYNTGLRGVLFEAKHYARMGSAVWLYGWLVLRQTHQTGTVGWVLGGAPIHYREIEEETGFNRRTLERWMKDLRRQKYIETAVMDSGITVKILKAKKHFHRAAENKVVRGIAGGVRKAAEGVPQNCVASRAEKYAGQQVTGGIGSSFLVRIKEKAGRAFQQPVENQNEWLAATTEQNPNYKTSWSDQKHKQNQVSLTARQHEPAAASEKSSPQQKFTWSLRERMRLLRAERDEEVRRELAVGTGPEVRHP
jgi:hypothetical protein